MLYERALSQIETTFFNLFWTLVFHMEGRHSTQKGEQPTTENKRKQSTLSISLFSFPFQILFPFQK